MAGELVLPGQLDLIAKIDIDRHQRKHTGLPVSYAAIRRARGLLELLPQRMAAARVNEGQDGSVEFTWERHDEVVDATLRLCAQPHGGVKYYYKVGGRNGGEAGGFLKPDQWDTEVIGIVRHVVAVLTPAPARTGSIPRLE
jgi:hypothetical protein